MHRTLNYDDLAPESAHLVKALMDAHYEEFARNQEPHNESTCQVRNIEWAASNDFTVEVGQRQIHEYIRTWALPSSWLYSLDYLGVTKEQILILHHYRARCSKPTPRSPIVAAAASVYFTVNRVAPDTQPVDVHYVVESNRLLHRAGRAVFREKWLADVIQSKILLRKNVHDFWTKTDLQTSAGTMDSAPS